MFVLVFFIIISLKNYMLFQDSRCTCFIILLLLENKSDDKSTVDAGDDKKSAVTKDKIGDAKETNDSKEDNDSAELDKKIEGKEKNGTVAGATGGATTAAAVDKKKSGKEQAKEKNDKKADKNKEDKSDEVENENQEVDEDDENVVALAEIDRINDNINKTRVDGLQTLHEVCIIIIINAKDLSVLFYIYYIIKTFTLFFFFFSALFRFCR